MKKRYLFLGIFLIVGFWSAIMLAGYSIIKGQNLSTRTANKQELTFVYPNYNLTIETLHGEILEQGIYFDTIVLCQGVLETGWFSSYNCTERNNLFGMTGGKKCESNTHGYAIYRTWQESVKAYKLLQLKMLNYYQILKDWGYHESEDYEFKCESIKRMIFKN